MLPTDAMTESFPICSNPCHPAHGAEAGGDGAAVVRLHTVGPALGPKLCVLHAHPDDSEVAPGEEGEV